MNTELWDWLLLLLASTTNAHLEWPGVAHDLHRLRLEVAVHGHLSQPTRETKQSMRSKEGARQVITTPQLASHGLWYHPDRHTHRERDLQRERKTER